MYIQQFFVAGLGHASYLIGDEETGDAAVFDPKRDSADYLTAARNQSMRITHVFETHVHNDFVSGARDLVALTGAIHHLSINAQATYPYNPVHDGSEVLLGNIIVRVLETPGHTPEHVSYAVIDRRRANVPVAIFTGGDLLVGTVGRPDLLGPEMTKILAPALYHSLHDKIMSHEDYVEVYPTHGAGSLCGRGINSKRTSTIGYERRFNPALQQKTEEAFVGYVLTGDPTIPAYYARMRPMNQQGPTLLNETPSIQPMFPQQVNHALEHGALVLDTRDPAAFGGAHIPGAVSIGLTPLFSTWVGSLVSPTMLLILVVQDEAAYAEATTQLRRIGYSDPVGFLMGGMSTWASAGLPVNSLNQTTVHALREALTHNTIPVLLDVRTTSEWEDDHIAQAVHIPLTELQDRLDDVPREPLTIICGSGYRSTIACSLLSRAGRKHVTNVIGGMAAWKAASSLRTAEVEYT